jgi:dihydrofolate reductase
VIGLIWAQAANGVIGRDNGIPWHIPADMAHFKQVTAGSAVLMGRRTWESLPPRFRPLPGRRNLVLTRDPTWTDEGAEPVHDLEQALRHDPVWVMGGADVYRAALPYADVVELTELRESVDGDVFAPAVPSGWILERDGEWQESGDLHFRWRRYRSA